MNYWLDLFTGATWSEFRDAGAQVSGFSARRKHVAQRVKKGDIFLCYMTGVMRWVGALEVIGLSDDKRRIWKDQEFPVRFEVKPIMMLNAEHGLPMENLVGRVSFFATAKDKGKFRGIVRASPNALSAKDGEFIFSLLQETERSPVARPVATRESSPRNHSTRSSRSEASVAVQHLLAFRNRTRLERRRRKFRHQSSHRQPGTRKFSTNFLASAQNWGSMCGWPAMIEARNGRVYCWALYPGCLTGCRPSSTRQQIGRSS
jgi:hypothetical protein